VRTQKIVVTSPPVRSARPLGIVRATMATVDGERAVRARLAREPLASLSESLGKLSIPLVWSAWHAARRSRM